MKPLYLAIAAAAGIAAVAALVYFVGLLQPSGTEYSQGNFTVRVLEDSSRRFLARVENNGPVVSSAGAFGVKKGLNENCEPQGIVVANFDVQNQSGNPVPNPDSIPGDSSVTLDSRRPDRPDLSAIPTGSDFETTVYILRFEPGTIQAADLIERIPIQEAHASELELFENCLVEHDMAYPVQLKLINPQKGTQAFITVADSSDLYETAVTVGPDAPEFSTVFWPTSKTDWLAANFTQQSGPAPQWNEQKQPLVSVRVVSAGEVVSFEGNVEPQLVTTSLDFLEVAKGNPLPSYPKYWEVRVDLANRTLG